MTLSTFFMWTLACCWLTGCRGQVTVTQPAVETVTPGSTVTLTCKTDPNVHTWTGGNSNVQWYQQKPGQAPKLLIYNGIHKPSGHGVPDRFTGRGDGVNAALTISGAQAEDASVYYCQSYHYINSAAVWTFGGGTKLVVDLGVTQPSLTVLPPSSKELQKGTATLVCLASGGFPPSWSLGWKVGSRSSSSGVSHGLAVPQEDGRYRWSSTLSLSAEEWRKAGSVSCEASLSGQSPVTQSLDPQLCSE